MPSWSVDLRKLNLPTVYLRLQHRRARAGRRARPEQRIEGRVDSRQRRLRRGARGRGCARAAGGVEETPALHAPRTAEGSAARWAVGRPAWRPTRVRSVAPSIARISSVSIQRTAAAQRRGATRRRRRRRQRARGSAGCPWRGTVGTLRAERRQRLQRRRRRRQGGARHGRIAVHAAATAHAQARTSRATADCCSSALGLLPAPRRHHPHRGRDAINRLAEEQMNRSSDAAPPQCAAAPARAARSQTC